MDIPERQKHPGSLRFIVIGAGAIGTYVGGSLALSGQDVVFIDRAETAEIIQRQGMRIRVDGKSQTVSGPTVFSDLDTALREAEFDVAIICVKSFDTLSLAQSICKINPDFAHVLSLQNGVENERLLSTYMDPSRVIAGTLTSSIRRVGTADIILERRRGIGIAADHPLSAVIRDSLNAAGLNVQLYEHAQAMKWSKMLTNLLANATSAILDMTPDEIFADPDLYSLEVRQMREALAVMEALDLPVVDLPGLPVRLLAFLMRGLPVRLSQPIARRTLGRGRGGKMPSFHIDLHGGKTKSEVDYLNGAVVRFARQLGIEAPVNQLLNETLLALMGGTLKLEQFSGKPGNLLALL